MDTNFLIPIFLFSAIFGMFYLYISTRNKERLALIEKGADSSIYSKNNTLFQRVVILNLGLLLVGIGLGIFFGLFLSTYTPLEKNSLYPASIFTFSGISLLIGFKITKNLK